ncbi:peptidoglycan-binding protein [Oceanicella sp. SM1341]|uniref:peptidoglycan-binding protein n=1 Tax=Oceanicella sp. SM1341 TaxID=1548889 RepID=UPI001E65C414|nr:peptidoglycan-binding protein [Oceanicella sp. SM1341]
MTFEDRQGLISTTELPVMRRRRATTDPDEHRALGAVLRRIRALRDTEEEAGLADLVLVDTLAECLAAAVAALRNRPFDAALGTYQAVMNRLGAAVSEAAEGPARLAPEPVQAPAEGAAPEAGRLAALYADCRPDPARLGEIDHFYLRPLLRNRALYEGLGARLGIPWWFIGLIHGLEASFSLETHLHNGDPLSARTVHHPPRRPATGSPPFTWTESATDALTMEGLAGLDDWSLGPALDRLERYNGLGYRNRGVPSPYLWSFSNHYTRGKFVADGRFDPDAVSKQCGAAVLLRRLEDTGAVETGRPLDPGAGAVAGMAARFAGAAAAPAPALPEPLAGVVAQELDFPGEIARGQKDAGGSRTVARVQEWCSFHGARTDVDGDFGGGTEAAVKAFQLRAGLPQTGRVDERVWAALTAPMHRALARPELPEGAGIYEAALSVARLHLAEHPVEFVVRGQGNCGPWVRLYMHGREGDDQPWCAGFVSHVLAQAGHALGLGAPIPRQVGVDALVADAKASGRFVAEAELGSADHRAGRLRPGALFCVRASAADWTHVGFVTEIAPDSFATIEGNTNDEGSREGFEVCARSRGWPGRDFVLLA